MNYAVEELFKYPYSIIFIIYLMYLTQGTSIGKTITI